MDDEYCCARSPTALRRCRRGRRGLRFPNAAGRRELSSIRGMSERQVLRAGPHSSRTASCSR